MIFAGIDVSLRKNTLAVFVYEVYQHATRKILGCRASKRRREGREEIKKFLSKFFEFDLGRHYRTAALTGMQDRHPFNALMIRSHPKTTIRTPKTTTLSAKSLSPIDRNIPAAIVKYPTVFSQTPKRSLSLLKSIPFTHAFL